MRGKCFDKQYTINLIVWKRYDLSVMTENLEIKEFMQKLECSWINLVFATNSIFLITLKPDISNDISN